MRRLRYSDADSHLVTVRKTITDVHAGGLLFRIASTGKKTAIDLIETGLKWPLYRASGNELAPFHAGGLREAWLYASKSNLQDSLTRRQGQPKCLIRRAKLHSSTTLD